MSLRLVLTVGLILSAWPLIGTGAEVDPASLYSFAAAPAWANPATPDYTAQHPAGEVSGGSWILMFDRQIEVNAQGDDFYSHIAIKILNTAAVDERSQINWHIDPAYQSLLIHSLRLVRNGAQINERGTARITALPEETRLEERIYDGAYNINVLLSDVRVGDVVEYEYTIRSVERLFPGHFAERLMVGYSDPMQWERVRLIYPASRHVNYRISGAGLSPKVRDVDGHRELSFIREKVRAIQGDANRPEWYQPWPVLEFSDFDSWLEVNRRFVPLYRLSGQPRPAVDAVIASLQATTATPEQQVMHALRFVQENIRYTSIAIGPGSQTPADPQTVLERHFGDCKDKSLLLATLLQKLGIDARPVLVHSKRGRTLPESLPSPYLFDHAITRVRIGAATYWLDGTEPRQSSRLDRLAPANFQYALDVGGEAGELERIPTPDPAANKIAVHVEVDLRKGLKMPAELTVNTRYTEGAADDMRADLARRSLAQRESDYLNFYARAYPGLKSTAPISITDDLEGNILEIHERYLIEKPFSKSDSGKLVLEVHADELYNFGAALESSVRTSPLSVGFPENIAQSIDVYFPEEWPIKHQEVHIDNPAFRYRSAVNYADRVLKLAYEYQALTDHVDIAELPQYAVDRRKLGDDLEFRISYREENEKPAAQDAAAAARKSLQEAATKAQNADAKAATAILSTLNASPGFDALTPAEQHEALMLEGLLAFDRADYKHAQETLSRAGSMPQTVAVDWQYRCLAAYDAGDENDAVFALTQLARRWPPVLGQFTDSFMFRMVSESKKKLSATDDRWFELLDALQLAGWKPSDGVEPSDMWRDLAVLQIGKSAPKRAAEAAAHITSPRVLIGLRVDNRFVPIVKLDPAHYDIDAAAAKQLDALRAASDRAPQSMQALVDLSYAMLEMRQYAEVLTLTESVLRQAAAAEPGHEAFSDAKRYRIWIMDNRARALHALGRWDEEVEQLLHASRLPEDGGINVSQAINLGASYCNLGRPKDALAAISEVGVVSSYGRMQLESVKHTAAMELGDTQAADNALEYLRVHQSDAPATLTEELVKAGAIEEASATFIARLNDPTLRNSALIDAQSYMRAPAPPDEMKWRAQWERLLARPEVKTAIIKVGRIERFSLAPPGE